MGVARRKPHVWAAPEEPGHEVQAVRDRYNRRWVHPDAPSRMWEMDPQNRDEGWYLMPWLESVRFQLAGLY